MGPNTGNRSWTRLRIKARGTCIGTRQAKRSHYKQWSLVGQKTQRRIMASRINVKTAMGDIAHIGGLKVLEPHRTSSGKPRTIMGSGRSLCRCAHTDIIDKRRDARRDCPHPQGDRSGLANSCMLWSLRKLPATPTSETRSARPHNSHARRVRTLCAAWGLQGRANRLADVGPNALDNDFAAPILHFRSDGAGRRTRIGRLRTEV